VTIPRKPKSIADCNCSICRRYGTLWAYYKAATVTIDEQRARRRNTTAPRIGNSAVFPPRAWIAKLP
jgi:hypothetical protein